KLAECAGPGGNELSSARITFSIRRERTLHPIHVFLTLQQPIHGDERIIHLMVEQVTCRTRQIRDLTGRRFDFPTELLEWAIEPIENAVELHTHLKSQCPARDVVRRCRRRAWVCEIVGMILRLEHIEDLGPEGRPRYY